MAPLGYFLLLGAAFYAAHKGYTALAPAPPLSLWSARSAAPPSEEPLATLQYSAAPHTQERRRRLLEQRTVTEQLLLTQAFRAGHHLQDDVVRARLVRNMRFLEPHSRDDEETLLRRALKLGLHRHDPVVRRRMVQLHTRLTTRAMPLPTPSSEELSQAAQRLGLAEHYRRRRFGQVFVSRGNSGNDTTTQQRARQLLQQLRDAQDVPKELNWEALGDARPAGSAVQNLSQRQLAAQFGVDFAAQLFALPMGRWQGPLPSSHGLHLVLVYEERSERATGLRPLLEQAVREEHRRRQAAERWTQLRKRHGPSP